MGKVDKPPPPADVKSPRGRRARPWCAGAAAVLVLLAVGLVLVSRNHPAPPFPNIPSVRLDPAMARLLEQVLAETRAARRSAAAWGKLGSVLMHCELTEQSGQAFAQAEQLAPNDPRWPYLHALMLLPLEPNAALPKLERAVAANQEHDVARWRLAQALAEHGRFLEAGRHFETLLRAKPNHAPALLGLARCRQSEGRFAEATNLAARCLSDPHTAKAAHLFMATVERTLGNLPAAAAALRRFEALRADAPWPDPWWDESLAFRVGRKARVEAASELVDQGRFVEALTLLAVAAQEYPDDEEILYLKGWALNQQQQFEEAETVLRLHLRLSPHSAKGHAQLAAALLGERRYEAALEVLQAGVQLKPTWREFHSNLGFASVHLARPDDAIRHYRNALVQDPNHAPSCTALGELLARRGDEVEARQVLRQGLELNPSDSRARMLLKSLERAGLNDAAPTK